MRTLFLRFAVVAAASTGVACSASRDDEPLAIAKVSPARLSNEDGWRLFDRSISSAFAPPPNQSFEVTLDRVESLVAIKAFGPASYRVHVVGIGGITLGIDPLDLSVQARGWQTFQLPAAIAARSLVFRFEPIAGAEVAPIPEIELWALDDVTDTKPDLLAKTLADGLVAYRAGVADDEIAPGACASFTVTLSRPATQFFRAHLAYSARGPLGLFALRRSINGALEQGGTWLAGDGNAQAFIEEIDPQGLQMGANEVRICAPTEASERVAISELRIVGELDRGTVARIATAGRDAALRDASVLLDGDPATTFAIAAKEPVSIRFDRLIAPDAITLSSRISSAPQVGCIDASGRTAAIEARLSSSGEIIMLDGRSRACAAITITLDEPLSLSSIDVIGSGSAERVDFARVVVSSRIEHFGDRAWVGGFVTRPRSISGAIRVDVAGIPAPAMTGDFGTMLTRSAETASPWSVEIAAKLPDGTSQTRTVVLDQDRSAALSTVRAVTDQTANATTAGATSRFGVEGDSVVVRAPTAAPTKLRLGTRVGLDVPAGAVTRPTSITARHLGTDVLPPLDAGMINVTAPRGHGYEFLPHGQKFARPVEVLVPFDRQLIPEGKSTDDVHTYYFDPVAERWKRLSRRALDLGEGVTRSSTDHFTIMINAVLAAPTNPSPLAFDPTTLTSIGAASPAANIDLIEPPRANSTGDARTALPIRLPAGRGAFTPSLAISYASGNGNGWLGVGWDVSLPRIEIDTRWGTPKYTRDGDRYIMDGTPLVPTLETDGPRCQDGQPGRRYRARIEGAFAHILRCERGPSDPTYHFELRDRDGTLFVFGADSTLDTSNASLASYADESHVFRWNLAKVRDVHGNTTRFQYAVDDITETAEPGREVYPASIAYSSNATGLAAAYTVEFVRDIGTRPDRIVSGRAGFKMVTRHVLRAIRVKFQGSVVRDYVLNYQRGQFEKTRLGSVAVYGVGGCTLDPDGFNPIACPEPKFFEHAFSYFEEDAQFSEPVEWAVEGDLAPTKAALGKGKSGMRSVNVGVSYGSGDFSANGAFNTSSGERGELVGMYDIDGNGLVDQVFDVGDDVRVLYNQSRPDLVLGSAPLFAATTATTTGLDNLGGELTHSWGHTTGGKAYVVSAGAGFSSSTSRATRTITDIDGDGFSDLLSGNGFAARGQPCLTGMCFTPQLFGAPLSTDPLVDRMLTDFRRDIDDRLPIADPVIQWVAPFDGTVIVSGVAQKPNPGGEDGVTVEVYHQDTLLAGASIAPNATGSVSVPADAELDVVAGEAIYLRVATNDDDGIGTDGTLRDLVATELVVRYVDACTASGCAPVADPAAAREPTGRPVFVFDSHEDIRIAGLPEPFVASAEGTLELSAQLVKRPSLSDMRVCVQRFSLAGMPPNGHFDRPCSAALPEVTTVLGPFTLAADADLSQPLVTSIPVQLGELIVVRVESDLSFDPNNVALAPMAASTPSITYSRVCLPNAGGSAIVCSTDPTVIASVPLLDDHFGAFVAIDDAPPNLPFVATRDGQLDVDSMLAPTEPFLFAARSDRQGILWTRDCRTLSCSGSIDPPPLPVTDGESITFELVSESGAVGPSTLSARYDDDLLTTLGAPFARRQFGSSPASTPFAGGYRRFRAALWNEAEAFEPTRLLADLEPSPIPLSEERVSQIARSFIPARPTFGSSATAGAPAWFAPQSIAFISAGSLHASKQGFMNPSFGTPEDRGGLLGKAYLRLSGTKSLSVSASLEVYRVPSLSFDLNASASWTKTTTELTDMNGDGIADVLTPSGVTLGAMTGDSQGAGHADFVIGDELRYRSGSDYGVGFGSKALVRTTRAGGLTLKVDHPDGPNTGFFGLSGGTGLGVGRAQTTKDLIDLNGDGLPDLVRRSGTAVTVQYNLGDHFGAIEAFGQVSVAMREALDGFEETVEDGFLNSTADALSHETTITQSESGGLDLGFVNFSHSEQQTSSRISRQVADVNSDGLPDLLYKRHGENYLRVQLNRGGDFAPMTEWSTTAWPFSLETLTSSKFTSLVLTGPDVIGGTGSQESTSNSLGFHIPIYAGFTLDFGGAVSSTIDTYELALMDVDGDGSADHVLRRQRNGDPGTIWVKHNRVTGKSNLLSAVHRPLGGSFTLAYERTANTVDLPHSRHVLSRVEVDDGVDLGAAFASPNLVTTIRYADGFFHRHEKQGFGFAKVTTTRADGVNVEQTYENRTYALQGMMTGEIKRDGLGRVFRHHATTYEVRSVLGDGDVALAADPLCLANLHPLLGPDACVPTWPVMTRDDDTRSEGGTLAKRRIIRDTAHDRFGNVLTSFDEGDEEIANDDVAAAASYANDTSRWILGRPTSLVVRAGNASGTVLRSRSGDYNFAGQPIALLVDTGEGIATTQLGYDALGSLNHVVTPPNELGETQTFDVVFDPVTGTYPIAVTDGFGYTSNATYDLRFGIATVETDRGGATLSRTLDDFGRLSTVNGPYDLTAPALAMSYFPAEAPPRAVTVTRASVPADFTDPPPAPLTAVTIADGLGQQIEVRKTAVVNGTLGMTTSGLAAHDAVGRTTKTYHPFFTAGTSTAFAPPVGTSVTQTTYDVLDRPLEVQFPDGESESMSYTLAAAPGGTALLFQTQVLDPNEHARETYGDFLGRTRAFVEHPTTATSSVSHYDYLASGELARIVDAESNVTLLGYDRRGLRTSMSNPDTGLITDRYDLMGNRIGLTEPNHRNAGVEVRYRYQLNRLSSIDYPSKPDVTFSYGAAAAPGTKNFGAGRLVAVNDETGSQQHTYGALGEVRRTIRTVKPAEQGSASVVFDLKMTSDSLGRQLRVGYPDGEVVTNTYDAAGMLASVAGIGTGWSQTYVDDLRYDVFGHRTRARYGNGVVSTWSFDPARLRLASVTTTLPATTKIQDLRYTYDPGSNPTRIDNLLSPLTGSSKNQPGASSLVLTYDGVDRLTHAIGQAELTHQKSTSYDQTFGYSATHNLTTKARIHLITQPSQIPQAPAATNFSQAYTYGARPHLPALIGDLELTYDPSGNTTARRKLVTGSIQTLIWDDDGRLVDVIAAGVNQHSTYDAAGLRVRRKTTQSDTIFSSPYYDLENGTQGIKHVFAADLRVASKLGKFIGGIDPVAEPKAGVAYFFHPDHLGSTAVLTDGNGAVHQSLEYFVDGETWIDRAPQSPVNGYLFNGKPMDPATGFYDFGQRFYDPRTSLWLGIDPAFVNQPNHTRAAVLAFAALSPLRYVDPDGRDTIEEQANAVCHADATCSGGNDVEWTVVPPGSWPANSAPGEWNERLTNLDMFDSAEDQHIKFQMKAESRLAAQGREPNEHFQSDDAESHSMWGSLGTLATGLAIGAGFFIAPEAALARSLAGGRLVGAARLSTPRNLLQEARAARDRLAGELGSLPARQRPATVTGGYNPRSGQVTAGACGGGKCAEDHVREALGEGTQFTEAVRPRPISPPYREVPVCERCEPKYGRDAFPTGTTFKSDQ